MLFAAVAASAFDLACMARPSTDVSTSLPLSIEAVTPVWSLTALIAFISAPFSSFALTLISPMITPLIVRSFISPAAIALLPVQVTS